MNLLGPLKIAPAATRDEPSIGAPAVFFAALGPMLTVSSLRRLLVDGHGGTPATVHAFVALGMVGAAIGAPLLAARCDARRDHLRVAASLAAIDAVVALVTASSAPLWLLFVLRPAHGVASMGLLGLLLGRFRNAERNLVAHAGAAMIAALAIGPAVGGALGRLGSAVPFGAAAASSAALAAILVIVGQAPTRGAPSGPEALRRPIRAAAVELASPLALVTAQRFAFGGFVAAFAVRARAVYHFTDARVGVSFSAVLLTFAITVFVLGKRPLSHRAALAGSGLFATAFAVLATGPAPTVFPALVVAGLGAALVYAPALAAVTARATSGTRATFMSLLHAAGALGMVLGPVVAGVLDVSMRGLPAAGRASAFMLLGGFVQFLVAFVVAPRLRIATATSNETTETDERNE